MSGTLNELSFGRRVAELKKEMQSRKRRKSDAPGESRVRASVISAARMVELEDEFDNCGFEEPVEEASNGRHVRRKLLSGGRTGPSLETLQRCEEEAGWAAEMATRAAAAKFAELEAEYCNFKPDEPVVGEPAGSRALSSGEAASSTHRPHRDVGERWRDRARREETERVREAARQDLVEWGLENKRRAQEVYRAMGNDRLADEIRLAELEAEFHNFRPFDPVIGESPTSKAIGSTEAPSRQRAHRNVAERRRDRARRQENDTARDRARLAEAETARQRGRETERSSRRMPDAEQRSRLSVSAANDSSSALKRRPALRASIGCVSMMLSSGKSAQSKQQGRRN